MKGIDLNKPVNYVYASLRYFDPKEYHVTRYCEDDVLVMVFQGVLRFTEDGTLYEIYPGQYHIQRHNSYQTGALPSDSPKYLFVHFRGEWLEENADLARSGSFDYTKMRPLMEMLDQMCHEKECLLFQQAYFYRILMSLSREQVQSEMTLPQRIAEYLSFHYQEGVSLESVAEEFHFSKNHIINLFKKEYGMTPIQYINDLRIRRAMWLLEVTSKTVETVAQECGFSDYSHFYKVFRKKENISPLEWRNRKRLQPTEN